MILWLDGALVDEADARVSPLDHGVTVGDGVFETLRVYGGIPFAWTRHVDRLARSAGGLGLAVPDPGELRAAAAAVLDANRLREARLRITVTGGPAPMGTSRGKGGPTVIIAASAATPWPPSVKVVMAPWTRNENGAVAGLKTTSYAENVRALAYAEARGASEAVFPNTVGWVCEATGSNVFTVSRTGVRTPPASSGCLLGVTRALVLELCAHTGIRGEEVDLAPSELAEADEAFLTSSTREVQPVSHVDGRALPAAPGPVTTALAGAFADLVRRDPDP